MEPPPQFVQWLRQSYPKPSIDENWLSQCYAWVVEEHDLNPATAMDRIKEQVESQLLMSDLTDSMVHGSGLPHNIAGLQKGVLSGPPVLVQITALTEIGHSAFSLMNVHQTKVDRADLAGLAQGDDEDEADEGPVPNYPRSMLKLELSDGAMRLNAIEYRKIPQLDLENTPLGFKIQLKNVAIRHGIAFLEPRNIILKGHCVEDLDVNRDRNFLSGLRLRLDPDAHNELEAEGEGEDRGAHAPLPVPAPAPVVPDVRRTAQPRKNAPATRANVPPIPGSSNNTIQLPPPPMVNDEHRRPQPLAQLARRAPQPHPSVPSSSRGSSATSSHFAMPGATMVAPMRLSPTRAGTEPLADEPQEPGSDWYFGHDGIDASFLSRAASELDRTEALLSQSSLQSFPPLSQPRHEAIVVDDKENRIAPRVVRRTLGRRIELDGSLIDLSAEIIEGPRIQHPIDNDDVISIGSEN